jgi:hypothetical protein
LIDFSYDFIAKRKRAMCTFGTKREGTRIAPDRDRFRGYNLSADTFGSIGFAAGRWVIGNTAMPQLAKFAADYALHAPVLDRTELVGWFDYKQPTRLSQKLTMATLPVLAFAP